VTRVFAFCNGIFIPYVGHMFYNYTNINYDDSKSSISHIKM